MSAPSLWLRKSFRWIFLALFLPTAVPIGARLSHDVVLCQLPTEKAPTEARAEGLVPADYGEGARLLRLRPDGSTEVLTADFASACDPDVSFDGEHMLFAAQKKKGTAWNIWESRVDGSDARQITHGELDARQPIYLSTFYVLTSSEPWYNILFVRRDGTWNEAGTAPATSLYTARLDGTEIRRISFNPSGERNPFLMPDGLLVFASWKGRATANWPEGRLSLFGMQTDGIDYSLYGGSDGARLQHMPTVAGRQVYFIESEKWPWDGAGHLAALDRRRPHHSHRQLEIDDRGLFHSPSPLPDGSLLVSRRSDDGSDTLDLYHFDPAENRLEALLTSRDAHEMHAKALAPRLEPDGRSSTVRTEFDTGKLYGLDVYQSQSALTGVEPGSIRQIRVIEALPRADEEAGGIPMQGRLLGHAPVEDDGSFHIDIPADLPVKLQVLDERGQTLASCDWIWVKQREFRGCIGCHEDPELTPENRFVKAVVRPATELLLPPEERPAVKLHEQSTPLRPQECAACHQGQGATP